MEKPYRIASIMELHRLGGFPKPHHPLISTIDLDGLKNESGLHAVTFDFYVITLKTGCDKLLYGQQKYDFDEGVMAFLSPGQVMRGEDGDKLPDMKGWMLFIHPDLLWNTPLAKKIKQYEFFGYSTSEALFLSDKEEGIINSIRDTIQEEYQANIDKFSQDVIIAHLEVLLTYAQRFYERQFITRKVTNSKILSRLENQLDACFNKDDLISNGLPTVQQIADKLHISTKYLSSLLKQHTGLSTQQHIHEKLIEKAKEKLSTTDLSVSEIAYELGFEHSQSFSKLFKTKTKQSPLEFRQSFN